jgi:hypothetical protein
VVRDEPAREGDSGREALLLRGETDAHHNVFRGKKEHRSGVVVERDEGVVCQT